MRGTCSEKLHRAALGVCALLAGGSGVFAQTQTTPFVLSGASAPGTANTFTAFSIPYLNNKSPAISPAPAEFVFQGFINIGTNDLGIWSGTTSSLSLVAREGGAAPGASGATFSRRSFQQPQIDSAGYVSFYSQIEGPGIGLGNNNGLWMGLPGNIQLAARAGDDAVGVTDAAWFFIAPQTAQIETGRLAFSGLLTNKPGGSGVTSGSDSGIWLGPVGSIALLAREDDAAPGASAQFGDMFQVELVLNSGGNVAFKNALKGPGVTPGVNSASLWTGAPGSLTLLARAGTAAPGGGTFFDFSNKPSLNDSGTIAVRAELLQTGSINSANDSGIYVGSTSANLVLLAREGTVAPGAGGDTFSDLKESVTAGRAIINSTGRVVFIAPLNSSASTNGAVFLGSNSGNLAMVAREGNAVPGAGAGVVFSEFKPSVTINNYNQVAFPAALTGTGVTSVNDIGLYAVDPFGQLVKVAREGDSIVVNTGDTRVVSDVGLSLAGNVSAIEGRPNGFNDSGLLVFSAAFTNGSKGVFTARVGGAARVTTAAPSLGPATTNGFRLVTPAAHFETVPVSGDIGYLKFVGVGPAGGPVLVFLDFTGSNIAGAISELNRGASIYNYTVSTPGSGPFDAVIAYATAAAGAGTDQYFYWNFANIDDVDLSSVMVAPEPGGVVLLAATLLLRRRR